MLENRWQVGIKKCKECGKEVSSKADKCPHCGVPIKGKPTVGCLGAIVIIIFVLIFIGKVTDFIEKRSEEKGKSDQQKIAEQIEKQRQEFEQKKVQAFNSRIEEHYQKLVGFYKSNNFEQASNELELFKRYNKLNYKDVATIKEKYQLLA